MNPRKGTRAVFLIAIWLILLVLSLSLLSTLSSIFSSYSQSHSIVSLSWAGYAVSDGVVNDELDVTHISATWTVPKVNDSAKDGRSSAWIGIGGQADKTLIQIGTEHDLVNGQESYGVWYELLPDYAIPIPNMPIQAYDTISASIALVDAASLQWHIQINDVTSGQSFSRYVVYNSTRSSGEWIVERPTVNNKVSVLADFGTVTFSNCQIKINGTDGVIGNFTGSRIQMSNQQTTLLASVSQLSADGSGFTVSFLSNI